MATPPMDTNLKRLLSAFNEHRVRYVIVGGYAVFIHAQPRMTKDLDVFIESSPENADAVYHALASFGAPLGDSSIDDFMNPETIIRFGVPPICFDILQRIDGTDFATVYGNSETLLIDGEVPARYISADDLITNKLASGRPQDLADVAAIRQRQRALKR